MSMSLRDQLLAAGLGSKKQAKQITHQERQQQHQQVKQNKPNVQTEQQKAQILGTIPSGRLGAGKDVAAACVYLASDEASYVTGQTLHVNGGMAMI